MIDGLQIAIPRRMQLARITVVVFLMLSVLVSLNLWAGHRYFPLSPVFDVPPLLPPFDYIYLIGLLLFLLASLFLRIQRTMLFCAIVLAAWLLMCDITRLQPWMFFYCSFLFVFVFYDGRVDDSNKFTSFFIMLQIMVAAVYFFSGINYLFFQSSHAEFMSIIAPLKSTLSGRQFELFSRLSVTLPYLLIFIGLGFIITPIRYLAIVLAVIMHLFLLVLLFPSGIRLNYALWMSNISFLLLIFLLFSGKTKQRYYSPTFLLQQPLFYLVFFVCVIFPFKKFKDADSLANTSYFSASASSSSQIAVDINSLEHIPVYEKNFYSVKNGKLVLDQVNWVRCEFNSGFVDHPLVYDNILYHLQKQGLHPVKETELTTGQMRPVLLKIGGNSIFASN